MIIYLDFDGTVVEHDYPKIGRCNYGCFEVIKKLQDAGHDFIINTYRVECKDNSLEEALIILNDKYWMLLKDSSLMETFSLKPFTKISPIKIHPPIFNWNSIHIDKTIYIDDIAKDIPLKKSTNNGYMVDWDELDSQFKIQGIY